MLANDFRLLDGGHEIVDERKQDHQGGEGVCTGGDQVESGGDPPSGSGLAQQRFYCRRIGSCRTQADTADVKEIAALAYRLDVSL